MPKLGVLADVGILWVAEQSNCARKRWDYRVLCVLDQRHCSRSSLSRCVDVIRSSTLLRCLRVEISEHVLNLRALAFRTLRMGFLVFGDMLATFEHCAALGAAILIGGHGRHPHGPQPHRAAA